MRKALALASGASLLTVSASLYVSHTEQGPSLPPSVLRVLPLHILNNLGTSISSIPLPSATRASILSFYSNLMGIDTTTTEKPLSSFSSLLDFRMRSHAPSARPLSDSALVCPCDGLVYSASRVGAGGILQFPSADDGHYALRQILGASEREPLAVSAVHVGGDTENARSALWCVVIKQSASDARSFVSPVQWNVKLRRSVDGKERGRLQWDGDALLENQRVALLGFWKGGFFSMVGTGDVYMKEEQGKERQKAGNVYFEGDGKEIDKGQLVGRLKTGNVIMVVFEAPENEFEMLLTEGTHVKQGQTLGAVRQRDNASGSGMEYAEKEELKKNREAYKKKRRPEMRVRQTW